MKIASIGIGSPIAEPPTGSVTWGKSEITGFLMMKSYGEKMKKIVAMLLLLTMAHCAMAMSMAMKRGPACQIIRQVDQLDENMVHLYLTPPKTTQSYRPGKIRLYLTTSLGTINVPLALDRLKDGRLHVRFYVKRLEQDLYYINVVDEQAPEELVLYSGGLAAVPMNKIP